MSPEKSVTRIISLSQAKPELLSELEKFRHDIIILFTDIKGSTAYFERHGDAAGLMMVYECNEMLRKVVEQYEGRVVKTIGDSIMALFYIPKQSAHASIAMQRAMIDFNLPKSEVDRVAIRIGLNFGPGIVRTADVFGDVVNVASRVESAALPGQILISESLYQQIEPLGLFKLSCVGRFSIKGKEGEQNLYELEWQDPAKRQVTRPGDLTGEVKAFRITTSTQQYRLQHIRSDGSPSRVYELKEGGLTVGQISTDIELADAPEVEPLHARFMLERGSVFVENLSIETGTFIRLTEPHVLEEGDYVLLGRQLFRFESRPRASGEASEDPTAGTRVMNLSDLLKSGTPDLVRVSKRGEEMARIPLTSAQIQFGRTRGDHCFPTDDYMSGSHARIFKRGEQFVVEDLGSRNGSFLRLRGKTPVKSGANVLVGRELLKLLQ